MYKDVVLVCMSDKLFDIKCNKSHFTLIIITPHGRHTHVYTLFKHVQARKPHTRTH